MHLRNQGVFSVDSVQTPLVQPVDQALNHGPTSPEPGLHDFNNHHLSRTMSTGSKVLGQDNTWRVL
jgi:hypothetical protein